MNSRRASSRSRFVGRPARPRRGIRVDRAAALPDARARPRAARDGGGQHTRLRWQAAEPGALWHADVCHGPALLIEDSPDRCASTRSSTTPADSSSPSRRATPSARPTCCSSSSKRSQARAARRPLPRQRLDYRTPPARVAIEACREAWHIERRLREWGHEPLVVDTTRVKQLGVGQHKRKSDRIDAEVLARAVEMGAVPLAHVLSPHLCLATTRSAVLVTGREGSCDARGARGAQVLGMRAHPGCPVRATLADRNRCPGVLGGLLRDPPTLPWPTRTGGGGRRPAVGRGLRRHLQGGVPRDEPPARPSRPRDASDPRGSTPGTR